MSGWLPPQLAYRITRRFNIDRLRLIYALSRRRPDVLRKWVRSATVKALPQGYDVDVHFNPSYNPGDQRMCIVPDGDLFDALSQGTASIVTDRISWLTQRGIRLESGKELNADIIVTATGLQMLPFGGIELSVDGDKVNLHDLLIYKAMMLSDVPNFAFAIGYTNHSWTLKVDLVADHLCRLLAHMDRNGSTVAVPVNDDPDVIPKPMFDLGSGYVQRAMHLFPQQGSHGPWSLPQSYAVDRARLRNGPVADPALHLYRVGSTSPTSGTTASTSGAETSGQRDKASA